MRSSLFILIGACCLSGCSGIRQFNTLAVDNNDVIVEIEEKSRYWAANACSWFLFLGCCAPCAVLGLWLE